MSRMPSMTALLGMLAIAGYQNRDKLAELLKGVGAGNTETGAGQSGLGIRVPTMKSRLLS
jgi:uncharacterized protein YidB (DUF937 family)